MNTTDTNYAKKMAQLTFKDKIIALHKEHKSVAEITKTINYRIAHTPKFKHIRLSNSTITNIIKKYKDIQK